MSQFEGYLIKGKGPAVYWVYHEQKHHVLNMSVFNKLFESQSAIKKVDEQVLESLSTGFVINDQAKIKQGENAVEITLRVGGQMIKLTKDMIDKAQFNVQELPNKKQLDDLLEKGESLIQNLANGKTDSSEITDQLKGAFGGASPEEMLKKLKSFMK